MRENVKKLIDLMESENWILKTIQCGLHRVYCFVSKDVDYPAIGQDGSIILLQKGNLTLDYSERRYFNDARSRLYNGYIEKERIKLEQELDNFFKTK